MSSLSGPPALGSEARYSIEPGLPAVTLTPEITHGRRRPVVEIEERLVLPGVARGWVEWTPAVAGNGRPGRIPIEDPESLAVGDRPYDRHDVTEVSGLAGWGRRIACLLYTSPSPRD